MHVTAYQMKKPAAKIWIESLLVLMFCGAGLIYLPGRFREGMVRPKNLFVWEAIGSLRHSLYDAKSANDNFIMPHKLPEHFLDRAGLPTPYADPFDTKKRAANQRIKCVVRQEGYYNGEPVDFTFRGNPLKFTRINDNKALVYSYGPDEDDDLVRFDQHAVADNNPDALNSLYDSTNGTISNGDCWAVLEL